MKPIDNICTVIPGDEGQDCISRAADAIRTGGVVVFPTRGLYGLAADAFNARAAGRIFTLKRRGRSKPLLVLISDMADIERVARPVNAAAQGMMRAFWPGQVTFVVKANDQVPDAVTGGSGRVGIRIPGHPVAAALVQAVGRPITGTSANLSGAGGCASIEDLAPELRQEVELILDAGRLAGGTGSTVVDICGDTPIVLREGTVAAETIMACHRRTRRKHVDNAG